MIIFVSDAFTEQYTGGAELTTDAIIEASLFPINKVLSSNVNLDLMTKNKNCFWIFGNFSGLSDDCVLYAIKNLSYSIVEYDYKFCKYRSIDKHEAAEGRCDCHDQRNGKLIATFFAKSKINFWMSEKQCQIYENLFPFLKNNFVLNSVFSDETLSYITSLDIQDKNEKWIILDSSSWIKGKEESISYAVENNLSYELVWGLSYDKMLKKLAKSKGLLFLPLGADTCPRLVMEAKLLGCELVLNENVQHKDEKWFESRESIISHLETRGDTFWRKIEEVAFEKLNFSKIESDSTVHFKVIAPFYNARAWLPKCIQSLKAQRYENFECYMIDDMSIDDSFAVAEEAVASDKRFKVIKNRKKFYALENIARAIDMSQNNDEDIIILLDGDDWLSTSYSLDILAEAYKESDCLMTYGSYIYHPGGSRGVEPSPYPQEVVESNLFREDQWRASHLRSFKYFLWRNLDQNDLTDKDNKYYTMAYDQAIMLPLLEMASSRFKYIKDSLYVYNKTNPLNVDKIKAIQQTNTAQEIRRKKKYDVLK